MPLSTSNTPTGTFPGLIYVLLRAYLFARPIGAGRKGLKEAPATYQKRLLHTG
jgi:hypothetical protein